MRVALVYPRANLDTVPSLVGTAECLAAAGHEVDVYTMSRGGQPSPSFSSSRIRVHWLGHDADADLDRATLAVRGLARRGRWLPGAARGPLVLGYRALGAGLAHGSRIAAQARGVLRRPRRGAYACVIGVDPDGLELAHTLARGAPLVYFSLELLLSYEINTPAERHAKARERTLSRQAAFVVVQDGDRGRLLAEDNDLSPERLVLVPNAPCGPARRRPSRYWHQRFDLSPQTRVVLHSGSLGDWTGIDAIVASVPSWPDDWVLVVHTRYDAEASAYVDALRVAADPRRVLFSLRPVPRQDYDALIDGAAVGLAFYVPRSGSSFTQRNVQTIGLSSGKLAYYLRAGLPVIVNRATSMGETIERSGSGVAVADAADIGPGLRQIERGYDTYSGAACAFFTEQLDFERAFGGVMERLAALSRVA